MEAQQLIARQLTSGDRLTLPYYTFRGTDAGAPALYLQSAIHGAETQGYWVALHLLEHFATTPPRGDVTIVPLANPYAINSKMVEGTMGRFDPVTGINWNRSYANLAEQLPYEAFLKQYGNGTFAEMVTPFKALMYTQLTQALRSPKRYAKQLNYQLQQLACQADIVLDLHCDTCSQPHVYSPSYASKSAEQLHFPFIISIPNQFGGALDESIFCPWWQLAERFQSNQQSASIIPPVEAFTIELGNQNRIDSQMAQQQATHLLAYCHKKGVCDPPSSSVEPCLPVTVALANFVELYAPVGGLVVDIAPLGQPVAPNQTLMKISQPHALTQMATLSDCCEASCVKLTYPKRVIPVTHIDNSNVHQGMAVMKLFVLE